MEFAGAEKIAENTVEEWGARLASTAKVPFAVRSLGTTAENRNIPLWQFGQGRAGVLLVGAHHAAEWITSVILFAFASEFAGGKTAAGVNLSFLCSVRTVYVVPMLNVDGVLLQNGAIPPEKDPARAAKIRWNGGVDFSRWQANARGVDLNHNYDAGFDAYRALAPGFGAVAPSPRRYAGAFPESEPETAALAGFIRSARPSRIVSMHTQGEEFFLPEILGKEREVSHLGAAVSRLTGYRRATAEGSAAYGGLCDYTAEKLRIPSVTLECGKGENPLPAENAFVLYGAVRSFLFHAATL